LLLWYNALGLILAPNECLQQTLTHANQVNSVFRFFICGVGVSKLTGERVPPAMIDS